MRTLEPVDELDARYSSEGVDPIAWARARGQLEAAEVYWLSTVRPDGRPHVTPVLAVWLDRAMYFTTGPEERKARNLAGNPHCVLTTGSNALNEGLDLVVEGAAVRVTDDAVLRQLPARTTRSTAATGISRSATAPSFIRTVGMWRWCSRSPRPRPLASARASSARPGGASSDEHPVREDERPDGK
jgi:hypothetical protein